MGCVVVAWEVVKVQVPRRMTAVGMQVVDMVMVVAMAGTQMSATLVVQAAPSTAAGGDGSGGDEDAAVWRLVVEIVVVVTVTDMKMAVTLVAQAAVSVPVKARLVQALAGLVAPAVASRIAA
jgi:hypothetical protein